MTVEYPDFHGFLLTDTGELRHTAAKVPRVRELIDGLHHTCSTFTTKDVDADLSGEEFRKCILLTKAWPFHEAYGVNGKNKRYVNPSFEHAHRYSDVVAECACGTSFAPLCEDIEWDAIRHEADHFTAEKHGEGCERYNWHFVKGELCRQRYELVKLLPWLGWKVSDIATRFGGLSDSEVCRIAKRNELSTIADGVEAYRESVGNTAAYLLAYTDTDTQTIADIYGHTGNTIRRYIRNRSLWGETHETMDELYDSNPPKPEFLAWGERKPPEMWQPQPRGAVADD